MSMGALDRMAAVMRADLAAAMAARKAAGLPAVSAVAAKAVLLVVANHAGGEDGACWASQATLELESGADRRTIRRTLRVLEDAGVVAIERRHQQPGQARRRRTSVLRVDYGALALLANTGQPDRSSSANTGQPDRPSADSLTGCRERNKEVNLTGEQNPPNPPSAGGERDHLAAPPDPVGELLALAWPHPRAMPRRDRMALEALLDRTAAENRPHRVRTIADAMRAYGKAVASGRVPEPLTVRQWAANDCHDAPPIEPARATPERQRAGWEGVTPPPAFADLTDADFRSHLEAAVARLVDAGTIAPAFGQAMLDGRELRSASNRAAVAEHLGRQ